MPYWIHRNGENVGPYDLPQLREMLDADQATAGDLAIEEGAAEWSTVGDLAGTVPAPASEPIMAELISATPVEESVVETATEASPALESVAASSSKLKLAIIGLVALLAVGGGIFAYTHFSSGDVQIQAQVDDPFHTPATPKNTPSPHGNKPGELPKLPGKTDPNPNTKLPAPLPPPPIDPPVITGDNKLTPQPAPEVIQHIPDNTIGVASINLGQLLKKAGGYQALLDKVMQAAGPEANDPMIKNMAGLFAPDKLAANFGIGINDPLLAFMTRDMKVGVLLPVADANKLELAIPNIAVMLEAELPELQPAGGYKYVAFPQQAAGVALGPKAVLVLIDTMAADRRQPRDLTKELDQLMQLPAASKGQLGQANANFSKHAQIPYDGALWLNVKEYIKVAGTMLPPGELAMIGNPAMLGDNFDVSAGMSFQKGSIVVEALMGYDEKLVGDWSSGANLAAGILDAIPGNTIAVLTQSMNMDVIRPFVEARLPAEIVEEMNAALANFGMNWDSLIGLPAGDLALSLISLKGEVPEILFSMSLADPSKANEVLGKVKASPIYEEMKQSGFDAMIKENVLHIVPLSLKSSIVTGQNGNPLNLEAQKLLAENDSAVYFSVASLTRALPPMNPTQMAMVRQFKGINVAGNAGPTDQRFTATINMMDPNTNVLQTLVNQAFQVAMNMQRQLDKVMEIPNGPDGDSGFGESPPPPDFGNGGDDFPRKTNKTVPIKPRPFPPPPDSGGESKSGGVKLPPQPPLGNKRKPLPPPTPALAVPEPNPFNPK